MLGTALSPFAVAVRNVLTEAGFSPADISFTSGLWLDPSDTATGFLDTAGTTLVSEGEPVARRNDKSGNGLHLSQAVSAARPVYSVIGGIHSDYHDGIDDGRRTDVFPAGTLVNGMDYLFAVNRSNASNGVTGRGDGASKFFGAWSTGDASSPHLGCGTPTYYVNGVAVASTRGALAAALPVGTWKVLEIRGLDLSSWTMFGQDYGSGFEIEGDAGGVILCPTQSTAVRNQLRTWLGAKVGLSI